LTLPPRLVLERGADASRRLLPGCARRFNCDFGAYIHLPFAAIADYICRIPSKQLSQEKMPRKKGLMPTQARRRAEEVVLD
jgi:hypothetical protein